MKILSQMMRMSLVLAFLSANTLMIQAQGTTEKNRFVTHEKNTPSQKGLLSPTYDFSVDAGTYADLTGATSVNNNVLWDDPEYAIPIGFGFQLYDLTTDSIYLGMGLGGTVSSVLNYMWEADYIICPFEADLLDRGALTGISQSPISYILEGIAGNRIFKLEWKNAGFYDEEDSLGTMNDYINFQLWLYEADNKIEFHYGPHMITDPFINYYGETGAIIGLADYDFTDIYLLQGNPANPTMVDSIAFLNGTPANGTIYRFSKFGTGVAHGNPVENILTVMPNPAQQQFVVKTGSTNAKRSIRLIDSYGRVVKVVSDFQTDEVIIDRAGLVNGTYFVVLVEDGKATHTGRVVLE
ncbi:MAG: T9SS type A sorting domain-containing protein [Bacteroidales bacterium]|nr:T9SS type A sorting domain-containing protein [Bacteroidales bacterium]